MLYSADQLLSRITMLDQVLITVLLLAAVTLAWAKLRPRRRSGNPAEAGCGGHCACPSKAVKRGQAAAPQKVLFSGQGRS